MTLIELKLEEHGEKDLMEKAYYSLLEKLKIYDYFTSGEESDSYKGYHGDPAHWCKLMREEMYLKRKPIAIDFSNNSGLHDIICNAINESGTSSDNFKDFCTERGLWFFFNLWGCGNAKDKYNVLIISTKCSIYPSSSN